MTRSTTRWLSRACLLLLAAAPPLALAAERVPTGRFVQRAQRAREERLPRSAAASSRDDDALRGLIRRHPWLASRLQFHGRSAPIAGTRAAARSQLRRRAALASKSRRVGPRRLAPALRQLIEAAAADRPLPLALLGQAPEELLRGDSIRLDLLPSGDADALAAELVSLGGEIVTASPRRVRAFMPYESLPALAGASTLRAARLGREPRRTALPRASRAGTTLAAGSVVSEGVVQSGADVWQAFDSGQYGVERDGPVRVAIVDAGFFGYQALLGGELPTTVTTADFAPAWDVEGCLDADPLAACFATGTALAEIVTDMNPAVELLLVAVDPDDFSSFDAAMTYLLGEGVPLADIVVGGAVWAPGLSGDGFGAGPYARMITRLTSAGVMWVNDTGDLDFLSFLLYGDETPPARRDHWTGPFEDQVDHLFSGQFDADGYMDRWLPGEDPATGPTWLNDFCLGAGDYILFDLVWDDWVDSDQNGIPETTEDYALDFWEEVDGKLILFDSSSSLPDNFQGGDEGDYPWDTFDLFNTSNGVQCYKLAVFAEFALGENRFHLYWAADNVSQPGTVSADFLAPRSLTAGNRMIPADTPGVVAVGSSSLADQVEPFSAFGLLDEGSPALCAPAEVSTQTFSDGGFVTSFAAAHVAGATSLLMAKLGFVTYDEALGLLEARARDITGSAPDEQCGSGRLCMITGHCN